MKLMQFESAPNLTSLFHLFLRTSEMILYNLLWRFSFAHFVSKIFQFVGMQKSRIYVTNA
jgi:hypothetical protein